MQKFSYLPPKNLSISLQYLQFIDKMTSGQEIFPRFDLFLIVTVKPGPATTRAAKSQNTQFENSQRKLQNINFAKLPFHINSSHSSPFSQKIPDSIICVK